MIVKVPVKKEVYVEEVEEVIVNVPVKKEVCGKDGKAGPNTFQIDIFCD